MSYVNITKILRKNTKVILKTIAQKLLLRTILTKQWNIIYIVRLLLGNFSFNSMAHKIKQVVTTIERGSRGLIEKEKEGEVENVT